MNQDKSQNPGEQQQRQPPGQNMVRSNGGSNDAHGHETDPKESRLWRGWATVERLQTVFNFLLVIVTAIQATVSYWQWQLTQDSLRLTQRAVESANIQARAAQEANELTREAQKQTRSIIADTERPWVGINHIELADYALGKKMGVRLHIFNSGKTPGISVFPQIYIGLVNDIPLEPPRQTFPLRYEAKVILFPNQTMIFPAFLENALSQDTFNSLESGTLSFIVWGKITYLDRFEHNHTTNICEMYNIKINPGVVSSCTTGNSAD
jgi:hypothetical protein